MNPKGKRYTAAEKQEVLDFITQYNAKNNGRGGVANASKHFSITQMTINAWIRKERGDSAPPLKKAGNIFTQLGELQEVIEQKEAELEVLKSKFKTLRDQI